MRSHLAGNHLLNQEHKVAKSFGVIATADKRRWFRMTAGELPPTALQ
jgi:hypothetical protein